MPAFAGIKSLSAAPPGPSYQCQVEHACFRPNCQLAAANCGARTHLHAPVPVPDPPPAAFEYALGWLVPLCFAGTRKFATHIPMSHPPGRPTSVLMPGIRHTNIVCAATTTPTCLQAPIHGRSPRHSGCVPGLHCNIFVDKDKGPAARHRRPRQASRLPAQRGTNRNLAGDTGPGHLRCGCPTARSRGSMPALYLVHIILPHMATHTL